MAYEILKSRKIMDEIKVRKDGKLIIVGKMMMIEMKVGKVEKSR